MSDKLAIPTGFNVIGTPCRYRIHPEEVFLFTLCKVATGMTQVNIVDNYFGGDKTCWIFAYPWMLRYLDTRYQEIVGHQGLAQFVDDFPRFHGAIEEYIQRNHQRELVDGTMTIVPGINFLPWDVLCVDLVSGGRWSFARGISQRCPIGSFHPPLRHLTTKIKGTT